MIQQLRFSVFIRKQKQKHGSEKTPGPPWSRQCYLQQPRHGNDLRVPRRANGHRHSGQTRTGTLLSHEKGDILPRPTMLMDLTGALLSELNRRQTPCRPPYTGHLGKRANPEAGSPAHTRGERTLGAARGSGRGGTEMGDRVERKGLRRSQVTHGRRAARVSARATYTGLSALFLRGRGSPSRPDLRRPTGTWPCGRGSPPPQEGTCPSRSALGSGCRAGDENGEPCG